MNSGTTRRPSVPKAGNSEELRKLEEEIASLLKAKESLIEERTRLSEENSSLRKEVGELKTSIAALQEKVMKLESANDKDTTGTPHGYVEIVAIPPAKGIRPVPKFVDGAPVARRIDEDGYCYDTLPVKNAIPFLTEFAGMKHLLIGPLDELKATVQDGLYSKEITVYRHKKNKDKPGRIEWIRVEVEESR
jgi:hypothetical protein